MSRASALAPLPRWSVFAVGGGAVAAGGGEDDVFIGDGWGPWLIPSDTNIDEDPQFAATHSTDFLKNYYLSQIAAGQLTDSPCVDAGSTTATAAGLDSYTTRTDHVADSNDVDMGYHYDASEEVAEYTLETSVFVADRLTVKSSTPSRNASSSVLTVNCCVSPALPAKFSVTDPLS